MIEAGNGEIDGTVLPTPSLAWRRVCRKSLDLSSGRLNTESTGFALECFNLLSNIFDIVSTCCLHNVVLDLCIIHFHDVIPDAAWEI